MAQGSEEALVERSARDRALLLYDYFKHMTTLSLVTLGGILSISQTSGVRIGFERLLPSLALVALAGAIALFAMEAIIKVRMDDRAVPRLIGWYRMAASGAFGLGVGAFLGVFGGMIKL